MKSRHSSRLRLATGLANGQLAVYARLVMLQRARLEARPPEDGEVLCQWLADYEEVFGRYGDRLFEDSTKQARFDDLFSLEECKTISEIHLEGLRRRAAAMGAPVNAIDRAKVAAAGWRRYLAAAES